MKITFDWLKDHLSTNLKEEKLLEQLTNIGLEVESVESLSADNELFKIAEIIKTEKHPNADRLKVCDVNIGENEINLVGVRFDQGIDFEFTVDTQINSIRAGEQILIVKNISAMKSRYGDEILDSIAGEFEAKTKLSNNGESLTLLAEDGSTIQSFTYSDQLPWPIGADGVGFTISLIDPSNNPDAKSAENWNISKTPNGSPAGITLFDSSYAKWKVIQFNVNSPSFDLESACKADPDNDGFSNALEYAFGTDPKNISRFRNANEGKREGQKGRKQGRKDGMEGGCGKEEGS